MPTSPAVLHDWLLVTEGAGGHHDFLLDALRRDVPQRINIGDVSLVVFYSRQDALQILSDDDNFSADVVAREYSAVLGQQPLICRDLTWRRVVRAALAAAVDAKSSDQDLRTRIRALVDEVLDNVAEEVTSDLAMAVAAQVSARVFAMLLGLPSDIVTSIGAEAAELARFGRSPLAGLRAARKLRVVLSTAVDASRQGMPGGLLRELVDHSANLHISDAALIDSLLFLTVAGTETTTAAISTLLFALIGHCRPPATVADRAAMSRAAVAETLRWEAPVQLTCRRVTSDCSVQGTTLSADSLLLIHLGAASLGHESHPDAAAFSAQRAQHTATLAFGVGPHRCPGARLARIEMEITASEFLRRFPQAQLADPAATGVSGAMVRAVSPLLVHVR